MFHVTSQDHETKGSGDFMEENSLLYISILSKLIAIYIMLIDI